MNYNININDKFVCCWGYDQTQYSVYNVVSVKGKSVFVEGLNSWSNFDEKDLAVGSKVKIYKYKHWSDLTDDERADYESRGFRYYDYERLEREQAIADAEVRTIVKANRVDGKSWTYRWELDDGTVYDSTENWETKADVKIIHGIKKCLVQVSKWYDTPQIKIDDVIRATLDKDYEDNVERYQEQNLHTAYNGR